MKKNWKTLAASAVLALGCGIGAEAQTTELFFSEYIEGSGNNKALEIYNGTGAAVNLATGVYSIELYSNGGVTVTATQALTGTIANNDVYVLAHASATAAFTGVADITIAGGVLNFNGDDAVLLKKNGVIIDVFGKVGWDPGTDWLDGTVNTANQTLVRKNTVCSPNTTGFSNQTVAPFTINTVLSTEWNESPQDTSSFLGSHTASCSLDSIAPNCTAIVPTGTGPSNTDKVSFFITFDEAVQNFDAAADVVINTTGGLTTSGVTVTGSLSSYVATVTGISGNGTLTLAVSTAAAGVEDLAGNDLASSVTSAAVTIANTTPASGVLLSETWSGASVSTLSTTPSTLVADNGWDITAAASAGTVQIISNGGDKYLEHTADGTSLEFNFVSPLVQTVDASTKSIKIEYETEYNALGTTGSRQWVLQAYASAGSLDGYQIRFTGETDSGAVLDVAVIDNGLVGTAVDLPPASGAQATGKRYKVTVVLTKVGSDTLVRFQAENLTDGGFIVPAGTQTLAGKSVDAGTSFDTAKVFARARTRALLDDINISFDVTGPVITRTGAATVNVNQGDTYTDLGATALDDFDGNVTANIVTVNPVNTGVLGPYTVTYNVTDASGNVATQVTRTVNVVDAVAPNAIAITPSTAGPTNADSVDFTVTFDEAVQNLNAAADLTITHSGTANSGVTITGGPTTYTASVTGITGDGSFNLRVNTGSDVQDTATNALVSSVTSANVFIDNTAPTIALTATAGNPVGGPFTVDAVTSEPTSDFDASDITVTNGSVLGGSFTVIDASTYSFSFSPTSAGSSSASVTPGKFTDASGNTNTGTSSITRTFDPNLPAVTSITAATTGPTNLDSINFTVVFDEDVQNFNNASDVRITHSGTANTGVVITGGPKTYTVAVNGISGDGSFTLEVSTTSDVKDLANNLLAASVTSAEVFIENAGPTATLSTTAPNPTNAAISVSVLLSEPSTTFGIADIDTTNAVASGFSGGGDTYTFSLTPTSEGVFSASVIPGSFTDAVGNPGTGNNVLSLTFDGTDPVFSNVVATPASAFEGQTVDISFNSSEDIAGDPDVTVNGHLATRTAKAAFSYSYTVLPSDPTGPATIQISGVDEAGNAGAVTDNSALVVVSAPVTLPFGAWPTLLIAIASAGTVTLVRNRRRG